MLNQAGLTPAFLGCSFIFRVPHALLCYPPHYCTTSQQTQHLPKILKGMANTLNAYLYPASLFLLFLITGEAGGCFSFLPDVPLTVRLGGSGAGWGRQPPNHTQQQAKGWACAPPQPRSPDEGAKGEMGGAAGVKITDPFIKGKKSENPKEKRKIMIKTMCK